MTYDFGFISLYEGPGMGFVQMVVSLVCLQRGMSKYVLEHSEAGNASLHGHIS